MKKINLPLFEESNHCSQGRYEIRCRACRTDLAFRKQMNELFILPDGDDIDFDCPFGKGSVKGKKSKKKIKPFRDHEGLGDTIEAIAQATGLDKVARAYEKVTGKDCGCGKRKRKLNRRFSFRKDKAGSTDAKD